VVAHGDAASWGGHCLIRTGCTRSPVALPACAPAAKASAWTEVLATAASRAGQVVRVRGPLGIGRSEQTLVGCDEHTCCNSVSTEAVIGGASASLVLAGLGCAGDESLQCCNVPAYGQTVVAEGRLQADPHGTTTSWMLAQPKLCVEGAASPSPWPASPPR
jgi:hypothetical protein